MNNHELFLEKVRPVVEPASTMTDKEFLTSVFVNCHKKRLTRRGLQLLKKSKVFELYHEIKIPPMFKMTPRRIVALNRKTDHPYFLDNTKFVTFDSKLAAHLILLGNDFQLWLR